MTETNYTPGVCNINTDEVAKRRKAGIGGLVGFILLLAIALTTDLNRFVRILLFVPAYVTAIGFLQAKSRFCVAYAAAGLEHTDSKSKEANKVTTEAMAKDQQRARQMNVQAFGIAAAATVVAVLLPSL